MRIISFIIFISILFSCKSDKEIAIKKDFNWQEIEAPIKGNAMQPYLFFNGSKLLMSWSEKINDSLTSLNYTELVDNKWSSAKEITNGANWFVNWADFPAIAENNGNIVTHYLPKSDPATFAYDVYLKQFNKENNAWNNAFKLHTDTTKTEHGFVTLLPYKADSFFTTWLDGRNTSGSHDHGGARAMTIRAAEVLFDGTTKNEIELDAKTCDCCQTSAAITKNGPIVVYRDRSDDEIRDIYISRFIDGDWTLPKAIFNDNWKITGCPVNGPKAATQDNKLAIAWFTDANKESKVKVIFSKDNGKTFDEPFVVSNGKAIGRVDIGFLDKQNALVSWIEINNSQAEIKVAKVNISKGKIIETVVSEIDANRSSGFPQLEVLNDKIVMAFNAKKDKSSTIKIMQLNKDNFSEKSK